MAANIDEGIRIEDNDDDSDRDDCVAPDDASPLCMSSFMTSLKSLVRDGTLTRVGGCGSNYRLSDSMLKERARTIETRCEERMGSSLTGDGGGGTDGRRRQRTLRSSTATTATPTAAVIFQREVLGGNDNYDTSVNDVGRIRYRQRRDHPREEPPRELPRRRATHVKNRMGEAETVSAVVTSSTASDATRRIMSRRFRRRSRRDGDGDGGDDDGMETDDDDDHAGVVVRIVPRRVSPRRMYVHVVCIVIRLYFFFGYLSFVVRGTWTASNPSSASLMHVLLSPAVNLHFSFRILGRKMIISYIGIGTIDQGYRVCDEGEDVGGGGLQRGIRV